MASRLDEFLKNASPEVKASVEKQGQVLDKHHQELKSESNPGFKAVADRSETPARNGPSRPNADAPEPSYGPSNQQPERRIDQVMNQKAQAQAAEQGKEATKSGASIEESKAPTPPAKEPER